MQEVSYRLSIQSLNRHLLVSLHEDVGFTRVLFTPYTLDDIVTWTCVHNTFEGMYTFMAGSQTRSYDNWTFSVSLPVAHLILSANALMIWFVILQHSTAPSKTLTFMEATAAKSLSREIALGSLPDSR